MLLLQGNTTRNLPFFLPRPSDGVTGVTGLGSLANITWTVQLSKNGGAFTNPVGAKVEIGNGNYYVAANATDENTLGPLLLHSQAFINAPVAPTLATATTGGNLAASTTYYFVTTYLNPAGQTVISAQSSVTTGAGTTNADTVTSPAAAGDATAYAVYAGTVSGGPYYLQNGTAGTAIGTSFVLTSYGTTGANPPSANTAAVTLATDVVFEVQAVNPDDAVRGGMTALPNANAGASNGLPLGDASGAVSLTAAQLAILTRLQAGLVPVASTVTDSAATTTSFLTAMTTTNGFDSHVGETIIFSSGANVGTEPRLISAHNLSTGLVTLQNATLSAPANGDAFIVTGADLPLSFVNFLLNGIDPTTNKVLMAPVQVYNNTGQTNPPGWVGSSSVLLTADHTAIAVDAQIGLTAQGYTTARAAYMDVLNGLVAAIWNAAASGITTTGSIGKRLLDFVTTLVYTAPPAALTDYQQRGVAVTLPTTAPTGYGGGTAPTVNQIAAGILATPANLLVTDGTGRVTSGTVGDKTGYVLATAPPTAAVILAAFKADADFALLLADTEGAFVFAPPSVYPGTGTLVLKDKANAVTLGTITLTYDSSKNVISRSVA